MTNPGLEATFLAKRNALSRFLKARARDLDPEDLLQELWMRVSRAGAVADPVPYLFRAANNLVLDRRRSALRAAARNAEWRYLVDPSCAGISEEPDGERVLIARERLERTERVLASLGLRAETIFRRHRIDGITQREIAAEMGISLSTIEKDLRQTYQVLDELRNIDLI